MSRAEVLNRLRGSNLAVAVVVLGAAATLPFFFGPVDSFMNNAVLALAYVVMALGLNIVVGFAGLLDLGYVAFYAFGSYAVGWLASDFYAYVNGGKGIHVLASSQLSSPAGLHFNFLLILVLVFRPTGLLGMQVPEK